MIKLFLLTTILLSSLSAPAAQTCKLPRGTRLTIGCGYHCDFLYRFRLRLTALVMGYPISFVNMRLFKETNAAMQSVDAILLPGGADIDPRYYLDVVTPELRDYTLANMNLVEFSEEGRYRDGFEFELVRSYSNDESFADLPMLGICRGMQMMSVAQGIPLYLDIKTELGIKNRRNLFDKVTVTAEDGLMRGFYGTRTMRGYKQHHQGIRMSYYNEHAHEWPNVKVTATSNKGLIAEAIEYQHRKALGVQYHPEKSFTSTTVPIYRWFLTQACEYKTSKDNL